MIPTKKEVKAVVSGLYITSVKGIRGPIQQAAPQKLRLRDRIRRKVQM